MSFNFLTKTLYDGFTVGPGAAYPGKGVEHKGISGEGLSAGRRRANRLRQQQEGECADEKG